MEGLTKKEQDELKSYWSDRIGNQNNQLILFNKWTELFCYRYGLNKTSEMSQKEVRSYGYTSKKEMLSQDIENNLGFDLELQQKSSGWLVDSIKSLTR